MGDTTLDLKNVRFTKGINYDFVNGSVQSLASGEMLVLARNLNAFTIRYGNTNSLAGEYTPNNLSNGGENIKLSFGAGVAIREFVYQDNEPWPEAADGKGYSLVLKEPQKLPDHNDPKNWTISSALGGSPVRTKFKLPMTCGNHQRLAWNSFKIHWFQTNLLIPTKMGIQIF